MNPSAVLISFNHPSTNHLESGAGVQFRDNITGDAFVLVHGAVFAPLVSQTWFKDFLDSLPSNIESQNNNCRQLANRIQIRVYEDDSVQMTEKKMSIKVAWKCPVVSNTVETLLHDWTLGEVSQGHHVKQLMAVFLILANDGSHLSSRVVSEHLLPAVEQAQRGREVIIESTPFGNHIFINSLSRGIVSNVVGFEGCLILTDARTVTGCEGGPIFTAPHSRQTPNEKGKLVGLVSCPLTWWRGEWVGLTIGVALLPVLHRLIIRERPTPDLAGTGKEPTTLIDETVVLVRCGSSWGSGFVISAQKGLILTCAHVVRNENSFNVWVVHRGTHHKASIVYRSQDEFAYDIALLKLSSSHSFVKELSLSDGHFQPLTGEDVVAAGFALFSERETNDLVATLVKGCIARVHPYMLQTTCCIQSGASGGPILTQGPDPKLVGLIVCNAQDNTSGAIFPHVNFAIPVSCFRDQIEEYIKTDDVVHLQSLQSDNGAVQSIWKLQSSKL